jgi:glycosyltransferase involved in cell wall biosynthesis
MIEVSIIIPTFNRSKILVKTLQSILNQTYTDYEIIVVSNGSTDDTEEVIKHFQDKRLRYFFQEGSGSPASPRNTGIKMSKGHFIAFCDDDDIWLPNKLDKQVKFLKENPDYDICCTKMKRFNDKTAWVILDEEAEGALNSLSLLYKNTVPLSSLVMRRKILNDNELFDEDKKIFGAEDYELILRLSKKSKIFCIQEYLLLYYSGISRFSNLTASNNFKRNLKYLYRLYSIYRKVVGKGFFSWSDVLLPLCANVFFVFKMILYDILESFKKSILS